MDAYIIPFLLAILLVASLIKKLPAYDIFIAGAGKALSLCANLFPFLVAVFVAVQLFRASGASRLVAKALSPLFSILGVPSELIELILIRPLSGSAALSLMTEIFTVYGADSYISRCAAVITGGSETVFYIAAVYFSGTNVKKLGLAVPISLFCSLFGTVLACALLRVM